MIIWKTIFALGLSLVPTVTEVSLPRHDISAADLQDAIQTLTPTSPRAPLPNSDVCSSWTDHHELLVLYRYDKAGTITNINYPGNLNVIYGWDAEGRLASVKDWSGRTWTFSYGGANRAGRDPVS